MWQPNYSHYIASNYLKEVATYNYVRVSENNAMANTTALAHAGASCPQFPSTEPKG